LKDLLRRQTAHKPGHGLSRLGKGYELYYMDFFGTIPPYSSIERACTIEDGGKRGRTHIFLESQKLGTRKHKKCGIMRRGTNMDTLSAPCQTPPRQLIQWNIASFMVAICVLPDFPCSVLTPNRGDINPACLQTLCTR
jgi:hypothetical protein